MPLNLQLSGNPRYQPKALQPYFGYDNQFKYVAEVEIATLETLADVGVIPPADVVLITPELRTSLSDILTTEVDKVESEVTKHDVRAWIRLAQDRIAPRLRPWIHLPNTSYDVIDTARTLQFFRAHHYVLKAMTKMVIGHLCELVRKYSTTVQIGRTHGQHALPITVGFWLATILSRILDNIEEANASAQKLVGKISGAVGAYNSHRGPGITKRCGSIPFEDRVLWKLALRPSRISTQILPPESLARYLWNLILLSASLGQFGRDGRHLMRTEIAEIGEPFDSTQTGSSTMAQKRNPINFENLEGTWLKTKCEFQKVLETLITDHQRDLVGSSIYRDFPTIVVNVVLQLGTLLREKDGVPFINRITVNEAACKRNFEMQGDLILAELMYIVLQMSGFQGDGHELVNREAVAGVGKGFTIFEATRTALMTKGYLGELKQFDQFLTTIPEETLEMLMNSKVENYIGFAVEKSLEIVSLAKDYLYRQE